MCHTCIITFRFGLQAPISVPSVNSNDSRCFFYHIAVHDYLTSIKKKHLFGQRALVTASEIMQFYIICPRLNCVMSALSGPCRRKEHF